MTNCSECENYNHNFCFCRRFDEKCTCKCQTDPKLKKKYDASFESKVKDKAYRAKVKKT